MRPERSLILLSLAGIAACLPGLTSRSVHGMCGIVPLLCGGLHPTIDMAALAPAALLPVLLLARGLRAGLRQLVRTRKALRRLVLLPELALAPALGELADALGIRPRLHVVASRQADALCYGLFRPRICITSALLDVLSLAEIEAVLVHERHHLRRRDPLRTFLWNILGSLCWWDDEVSRRAELHRELAADRAVIASGRREALAGAMLKLIAGPHRASVPGRKLAISGLSVTEARIDQLLNPSDAAPARTLAPWRILGPLSVAVLFLYNLLVTCL